MKHQMPCSVDGCDRLKAKGNRGYCSRHYTLWRRNGDPTIQKKGSPGTGCVDTLGYKIITFNGDRIREHRHVMEQHLGRPLRPDEIVHHKDGNKLNNDISNLEITSRGAHPKEHAGFRNETHKMCTRCKKVLGRESFHKNSLASSSNHRDHHQSWCKVCMVS